MSVVTFIVPAEHAVKKRRSRKNRESKVAPTRQTVSIEMKAWLQECVKTHWFLHEPIQRQYYKNDAHSHKLDYKAKNNYLLHISFQDPGAAALFKLTWL